ncbi:hypothetical protein AB0I81_01390 [Nonomuraea sp. NPDC050404]|uniref:hypothetical protein n=1 Tax=Nonomuraea sp. NPDC050404 TaxID=3155783 RepID=UPI0033D5D556
MSEDATHRVIIWHCGPPESSWWTFAYPAPRPARSDHGLDLLARHRPDALGTMPRDEGAQLPIPVPTS